MRNWLGKTSLVLGMVGALANPAYAQKTITLRFASPLGATQSFGVGAQWWMDQISERTDNRVEWQTFFDGSLVAGSDVLAALQSGRVDVATLAAVYNPGEFPLWSISTLPFMGDNAIAQMHSVYELYETDPTLQKEFEDLDIAMTLFQPVTPAAAGTSEEPVESPDGFAGKRLRAVGLLARAYEVVGAEPIAIGPTEIYEAIQRGVVDGYGAIGFDTMPELSLQEVAPHVVNPRVGTYSSVGIGFNANAWAEIPDDIKQVIDEVSAEYMKTVAPEILVELEDKACDALAAAGGTLTVFTPEQVAPWKEEVLGFILPDWRKTAVDAVGDEAAIATMEESYFNILEKQSQAVEYQDGMIRCAERLG